MIIAMSQIRPYKIPDEHQYGFITFQMCALITNPARNATFVVCRVRINMLV